MRLVPIQAVFEDGTTPDDAATEPLAPSAQDVEFPQWTDGRLDIECVGSDGDAYDVSGGAFAFTVKTRSQDVVATISHEAVITDGPAGLAYVDVSSNDTGIDYKSYVWNLIYTDSDGKIWGVVAEGTFAVTPSPYLPGQDVTVPVSQQPLAQGPNIAHVADYASLPAAAAKAWLFYETDDNGRLYFSNGSQWLGVQRTDGTILGAGTLLLYANPDLTGPFISLIGGGGIYFNNADSQPIATLLSTTFQMYGSLVLPAVATATDYQMLATDNYIGVTNTSAPRTVTLLSPNDDAFIDGFQITVKDESGGAAANNITLARNGARIDGVASNALITTNYGSRTLRLNRGWWWTVAQI